MLLTQVIGWLGRQGIRPWREIEFLDRARGHALGGVLLLSLHPKGILRVLGLTPEGANVEALAAGLATLRGDVARRPADFWEYRVAHRRAAALLQTAMMATPRLASAYAMLFESNAVVLIFGRAGPSLLLLLTILAAPHFALSILAW